MGNLHFWSTLALSFFFLPFQCFALNSDGVLLLSFKYSILSDPFFVLQNWNYDDPTPCSWNGIMCEQIGDLGSPNMSRVISLVLPNNQLLGSIPPDLFFIEHLKHVDLSNNIFNGTLSSSLFLNSSGLQVLSLSNNVISGELPDSIAGLKSLQLLNLSDNALSGNLPYDFSNLTNLSVVSLKNNYFFGDIPSEFNQVSILDLSSNLLNGSLPSDFGGENIHYLNLSYNRISGKIASYFAQQIPINATIDLSFNNLTGPIPDTLLNQQTKSFLGNSGLCGKPLKNLCTIPSTLSTPPNVSTSNTSSPAIAVIPETIGPTPDEKSTQIPNGPSQNQSKRKLKPGTVTGIVVGVLAFFLILGILLFYIYKHKKKTTLDQQTSSKSTNWSCMPKKSEEKSETTSGSDSEDQRGEEKQIGSLVIVDGETKLELERLLKASAYVLGTSSAPSSCIVYKAVLEDGSVFAVKRLGEVGVEKRKEFESVMRGIGKLRHPNLVRVRGFYWGDDEKLVICDYVSNGCLANISYRKVGSSPSHLPFKVRLRIARGIARGLAYIHEKKHVHGNLKPSNILLDSDMEPVIGDLGLNCLAASSGHRFESKSCSGSHDAISNVSIGGSPYGAPNGSIGFQSPYYAPESLKSLKPNPRWDVYSFGIILLELLTGRVFLDKDLAQLTSESTVDEKNRVVRMADVAIRAEMADNEDTMLACFKLGLSCACIVPQKRPTTKEALLVLEKIPSS